QPMAAGDRRRRAAGHYPRPPHRHPPGPVHRWSRAPAGSALRRPGAGTARRPAARVDAPAAAGAGRRRHRCDRRWPGTGTDAGQDCHAPGPARPGGGGRRAAAGDGGHENGAGDQGASPGHGGGTARRRRRLRRGRRAAGRGHTGTACGRHAVSDFVRVVEVAPRDGLQNEATPVATADKIALVDRLSATGLRSIEATSFVSPRWVPQLADAAEVMAGIARLPGVSYPVLVPNEQGYARARAAGATEVAVFTAASEAFVQRNINTTIDASIERFAP